MALRTISLALATLLALLHVAACTPHKHSVHTLKV